MSSWWWALLVCLWRWPCRSQSLETLEAKVSFCHWQAIKLNNCSDANEIIANDVQLLLSGFMCDVCSYVWRPNDWRKLSVMTHNWRLIAGRLPRCVHMLWRHDASVRTVCVCVHDRWCASCSRLFSVASRVNIACFHVIATFLMCCFLRQDDESKICCRVNVTRWLVSCYSYALWTSYCFDAVANKARVNCHLQIL